MSTQEPNVPSLTTLRGGEKIIATFLDGKTEEVFVCQPPIRRMDEFMRRYNDVQGLVELCCAKPEKWGDGLTDDSLFAIYEKARELNDPRFDRWLKAQGAAVQKLMGTLPPEMRKLMSLAS